MAKTKSKKKQKYADLDDLKKISMQWQKMSGLHGREDWSAAMVRAATAAEIAANFAIRTEFANRSTFNKQFVDKLLRWANGIDGKLTRLLIPLHTGGRHEATVTSLKQIAESFNKHRNDIVHSGHFMNKREAQEFIANAKSFVETLIKLYEPTFALKEHDSRKE